MDGPISGFRLSPQQKRLWSLCGEGEAFRARCVVEIAGQIDGSALERALSRVVARHEALRTTFRRLPGLTLPVQVVAETPSFTWRTVPPEGGEPGPALAACWVGSPEAGSLVLTLNALCADSRSLVNIARDLAAAYGGGELEEAVAYAKFSDWQNELLASDEADEGRRYWRGRNLAAAGTLAVPLETQSEGPAEGERVAAAVELAGAEAAALEEAAARLGASLEDLLLAGWLALSWLQTGQQEIVAGAVVEGRDHEILEEAVGLFARCLPVVCRFHEGIGFEEVVRQTCESLSEAREWQDFFSPDEALTGPFRIGYELLDESRRDESGNALFSVRDLETCLEPFTVKLDAVRTRDGLALRLRGASSRLDQEAVTCLALQLRRLLLGAARRPEAQLRTIDLAGERESAWLGESNETRAPFPEQALHRLFEHQAALHPERVAVVFELRRLTYGELNARANRWARRLRELGVGPDVPVGIGCERSEWTVVALLAVLKAGGAYVPLDLSLPAARLLFLVRQAGMPVLITQEGARGLFAESGAALLDLEREDLSRFDGSDLSGEVPPQSAAYVLFTSGSTGQPKGVAVEHRQIVNYTLGALARLNLPEEASFAMISTFAADLGNTALFPALASGGCLHLLSPARAADPEALGAYFEAHPVDCLKIVPSHLKALLAGERPEQVLPRRCLVLGGEACRWELVERVRSLAPDCRILNHYGPTEATVGATVHSVEIPTRRRAVVPLGRPLANVRVYIVDPRLTPVAFGLTGELLIGGAGVARGYIGQPALTAERFVPDPFGGEPGARLYRTGDAVRPLPGGEIEFLGRIDHQIKIRGFRVEPAEIEATLLEHPAVREAVVTAGSDERGETRLAAWLVLHPGRTADPDDLRSFLRQRLPEYMVPVFFSALKALPLTPNGKVDRRALERMGPPSDQDSRRAAPVAPRNPVEEELATIWCDLLGLETVGVYDSFFDLGGHSLLATQALSRMRRSFRVDVSLRDFFELPRVAELAVLIEEKRTTGEEDLGGLLGQIEALSDEEAERLLEQRGVRL